MKVKVTFASATQVHKLLTDGSDFDVSDRATAVGRHPGRRSYGDEKPDGAGERVQIGLVFKRRDGNTRHLDRWMR